ncbi:serine hydrolase domain-containing protein [soil metagenome]
MSDANFTIAPALTRRTFLGGGVAALALPFAETAAALVPAQPDLDVFIRNEMKKANIPGLAAGFAKDGIVRFARGYGIADIARRRAVSADTMFHIASVTKTVTATCIMRLVEAGKLALDEPVSSYLDFPVVNPRFPATPITSRQLLMHTSSIADLKYYEIDFRQLGHDASGTLRDFLWQYLTPAGSNYAGETCFSAASPGAAWDYSNVGFALLGYLADRVGERDMREQSYRDIFRPLGMRHTSWTIRDTPASVMAQGYDLAEGTLTPAEPVGFPDWPTGMLRSSIRDFTKVVAASANGGKAGGVQIVGAASMAQMLDMQTPAGLPAWLSGQGLGWMAATLEGQAKPNHWGGDPGVFTAVYLDPANRSGVAIFSNLTASTASKNAIKHIASRLFQM